MAVHNSAPAKKGLALLHILGFILVIVLNGLAVLLPLNGKTTGELSDQYPNLFTPAGITFSIWSVIYLLLLGFIIYQAVVLLKPYHRSQQKIMGISRLFLINCLANAGWIVAWHFEQVILSVCIMLVILLTLIIIHERLQLGRPVYPLIEKFCIDLPFSIYLGWISIATIANIAAMLVHFGWNGAGYDPFFWTVIMISLGTLLNMYLVLNQNNIAFGLVGIWAFVGIILKRQVADAESTNHVIFSAEIGISMIAFSIAFQLIKNRERSKKFDFEHENLADTENL